MVTAALVVPDLLANTDLQPDLLITMGSPLGIKALYREMEPAHWRWIENRRTAWVNIHNQSDLVTAGAPLREDHFPEVVQIRVRHPRDDAHRFSLYLSHPPVAQLISDVATGNRTPESPQATTMKKIQTTRQR